MHYFVYLLWIKKVWWCLMELLSKINWFWDFLTFKVRPMWLYVFSEKEFHQTCENSPYKKREKSSMWSGMCYLCIFLNIFRLKKFEKRPQKITTTYEDIENLSHYWTTHLPIYVRTFSLHKLRENCHILHP